MKINSCRGDVADTLAKKEPLDIARQIPRNGAEYHTEDLAVMCSGCHLVGTIPEFTEAEFCLMPSLQIMLPPKSSV